MAVRPTKAQAKAFQKQLDVFTKDLLPEELLKFTKALSLSVYRGVMEKTPVGNPTYWKNPRGAPKGYVGGHARMNWQISLSKPTRKVLEGVDPTGFGAEAMALFGLSNARPYQRIWIVNNVPYILVLENGRGPDERGIMRGSTQAPQGMLGVTLQEIRRDFRVR